MKVGTTEKIKFKRTKRAFGLPLWQAVGLIESVWLSAYQNAPAGDIGRLSNEDIAAAIEWEGNADDLIAQLVKDGWLDKDDEFRLIVHDWSEHVAQFLRGAFAKHGRMFADQAAKQRAKQPAKQDAKDHAPSTLPPIQFNSIQCKKKDETDDPKTQIGFPVDGGEEGEHWYVPVAFLDEMRKSYPSLNVASEMGKARAWIIANPTSRKTARGMTRFLNGWLSRAQNNGAAKRQAAAPAEDSNMPPTFDEFKRLVGGSTNAD